MNVVNVMNPPSTKKPIASQAGHAGSAAQPASLSSVATAAPTKPCELLLTNTDGSVEFSVIIPADIVRRLRNRAHTQALEDYVWHNVLKPALNSHVY